MVSNAWLSKIHPSLTIEKMGGDSGYMALQNEGIYSYFTFKNTVLELKYPSADEVTQNVHKSDTTASNTLCK